MSLCSSAGITRKRAQCNIPSLYVAVSSTFPTNSSYLCKLHAFNLCVVVVLFLILCKQSAFSFLHRQKFQNLAGLCLSVHTFRMPLENKVVSLHLLLELHLCLCISWSGVCGFWIVLLWLCLVFPPELWSLLTFSEWQSPFVSFYTSVSLNFHQPSSLLGVSDPHSDLISN